MAIFQQQHIKGLIESANCEVSVPNAETLYSTTCSFTVHDTKFEQIPHLETCVGYIPFYVSYHNSLLFGMPQIMVLLAHYNSLHSASTLQATKW